MRVRLVVGGSGGRFPFSNCLLVESTDAVLLVDAGCGVDVLGRLRERLDAVIFTHHHPDHISGYHVVNGRARVFSPKGEEAYPSLEHLARRFAGDHYAYWLRFATTVIGVRKVPVADEYYVPGEDVCFRSICVKTYPARGHMLTHVLVELPARWLHVSDIDLTGFGPWFGNPESDPNLFLADIEATAELEASSYTSSHRGEVLDRGSFLAELALYAQRLAETARRLLDVLAGSQPVRDEWELTGRGIIYRRYVKGAERLMRFFEAVMVRKLLAALYSYGCLGRGRQGFYVREGECGFIERVRSVVESVRSRA
jgi:glyoxylase-like metal-dependent hydrolase (beta-lactamase superfamily II)